MICWRDIYEWLAESIFISISNQSYIDNANAIFLFLIMIYALTNIYIVLTNKNEVISHNEMDWKYFHKMVFLVRCFTVVFETRTFQVLLKKEHFVTTSGSYVIFVFAWWISMLITIAVVGQTKKQKVAWTWICFYMFDISFGNREQHPLQDLPWINKKRIHVWRTVSSQLNSSLKTRSHSLLQSIKKHASAKCSPKLEITEETNCPYTYIMMGIDVLA